MVINGSGKCCRNVTELMYFSVPSELQFVFNIALKSPASSDEANLAVVSLHKAYK